MIAGIVVNLRYGWNYTHHELPWTNPNLMLCAFWVATTILSVSLFFPGNEYVSRPGLPRRLAAPSVNRQHNSSHHGL